ncbi:DUF4105 domain-containing protein [Leptospira sp. 96542]|nr:DUF4105 domain-containing protein [Leptospira sp. 96542]
MFQKFIFLIIIFLHPIVILASDNPNILELDLSELRKQGAFEPQNPIQKEYLAGLLKRSKDISLANERHWLRILRFKKGRLGSYTSEVDSESYFFSSEGKYNAEKELEATIRAFFYSDQIQNELMHPQCAYPERYHWLKMKLEFDPNRLAQIECPRFETWKAALNPESLSVVFSSYYMQAPSSMFGHTLIKLNNKENEHSELLDYGVNYAANPVEMNALYYAYLGLTGGYPGKFSLFPYYLKVNEYNDFESRDLWEYKLKLNVEERERFIRHLWEMSRADFDYFFLNENCSYHLLEILEVAKKDLELSDKTGWIVSPPDTIKLYINQEGLVVSKKYRSSLYSKIHYKVIEMSEVEKSEFWDLIQFDPNRLVKDKPNIRKTLVIDAVLDTYRYHYTNRENIPKNHNDFYKKLLVTRSQLTDDYVYSESVPRSTPPELSHPLSRVATSFGTSSQGSFAEFKARLAYHDLLNVSSGHAPNSELVFFDTTVRAYENKRPEFTSMSVIKLISINPYNSISKDFSYYFDSGIQTAVYESKDQIHRRPVGNFDFRYGYSFSNEFSKTPMSYGIISFMAGVKAQPGAVFENGSRYGLNLSVMYQKEFGAWKVFSGVTGQNYQLSGNKNTYYVSNVLRYAFNNANEFRIEINAERYYEEIMFSYHYLF